MIFVFHWIIMSRHVLLDVSTSVWLFWCIDVESIHLNGEGMGVRGGAKSSLLPLTSLCVSSPTHTCSPHWISFPFSNRKNELIFYIWQFYIFARSLRKKIQVFLVMRCWSEWKDWSSRAHNLIYIIYNLISWLTRKQQNIYSTALGTRAQLFVNWGKMHKIKHSHRGWQLSLSWTK